MPLFLVIFAYSRKYARVRSGILTKSHTAHNMNFLNSWDRLLRTVYFIYMTFSRPLVPARKLIGEFKCVCFATPLQSAQALLKAGERAAV
jgi:hypothetical protein